MFRRASSTARTGGRVTSVARRGSPEKGPSGGRGKRLASAPPRPAARTGADLDYAALTRFARRIALLRFGVPVDDAEEVAQEALLRMLRVPALQDPEGWIATAVRNLVVDRRRRPEVELPIAPDAVEQPAARSFPDQEMRLALRETWERLSPPERIVLRGLLEGLKQREIAGLLDCSVAQVGSRVQRLRTKIASL